MSSIAGNGWRVSRAAVRRIALAGLAISAPALADPVALTGEALRDAVSGSIVEIDTPLHTKVPVKIASDGSLSGEAGEVASYLGAAEDQGRWWIEQGQLCQRWTTWFHGDKSCLKIVRDGNKIAWERDDGETGTATLHPKPAAIAAAATEGPRSALGGPVPVARLIEPAKLPDLAAAQPALAPVPAPASTPAPASASASASAAMPAPLARPASVATAPAKPKAKVKVSVKGKNPGIAAPAVSFWVNGVEEDDVLNVRQGPSAETAIIGVIPPLSRGVRISGACVEMWCPVQFNKVGGWVNRSYLVYDVPDVAAANPRSVKFQRASAMSN